MKHNHYPVDYYHLNFNEKQDPYALFKKIERIR